MRGHDNMYSRTFLSNEISLYAIVLKKKKKSNNFQGLLRT